MNSKFPVTFYDLEGKPILGAIDGKNGKYPVTAYDTSGNYVDLSSGGGGGGVTSVNGQTGVVNLTAGDVGAYDKTESDDMFLTENKLTIDFASMNTPQLLTPTPTVLLIEDNTDNLFTFDPVEHSFIPKVDGFYLAIIQCQIDSTSNGAVFKSRVDINGTILQGEEQEVDSGLSIVNFTLLIPNATTSQEFKFLLEDEGAGGITVNQARIYLEKKVVL